MVVLSSLIFIGIFLLFLTVPNNLIDDAIDYIIKICKFTILLKLVLQVFSRKHVA